MRTAARRPDSHLHVIDGDATMLIAHGQGRAAPAGPSGPPPHAARPRLLPVGPSLAPQRPLAPGAVTAPATPVGPGPAAAPAGPPVPAAPAADAGPPPKKRRAPLVLLAFAVALGGVAYGAYGYYFEDTDDAQIDANISTVSPRATGTVTRVHVADNQQVKAGDLLVELDDRDARVALDVARAALAQAEAELAAEAPAIEMTATSGIAQVETAVADVAKARASVSGADRSRAQAAAQLAQAQAALSLAATELDRSKTLFDSGLVAKAELDQRTTAYEVQKAHVAALRENMHGMARKTDEERALLSAASSRMKEAKSNSPRTLEMRHALVAVRKAKVAAAKAQVMQAELELSYMEIHAPVDGIVGRRSVALGDRVQPGQGLFALTQLDGVWVTANFRETQLARVHPGQKVTLHVDTLGKNLYGSVESLGGATGSKFSLFPPENASANYVKVVQRMPVRIRFYPGQPEVDALRPGMSVEPRIRVR